MVLKYVPLSSSIQITWELIGNANSWTYPRAPRKCEGRAQQSVLYVSPLPQSLTHSLTALRHPLLNIICWIKLLCLGPLQKEVPAYGKAFIRHEFISNLIL